MIDALAHIYRAYYSIRGLSAPDGTPTNAAFGFTAMLRKLLKTEKPDFIAVAFDLPEPTARHEQFLGYKAKRKPMPDDLKAQLPIIRDIVRAMNIPVVELPGYEADDVLGTLARRGAEAGLDCFICTTDKDALQLLDEHIVRYETKTGEAYTAEKLREEMNIEPRQIIDVMSLSGDTSDNIPGVEGVGPKIALQLIREYGTLENVLDNAEQIKQKKRRERLIGQAETARMSKQLVTIDTDVPVEVSLEDCRAQEPDLPALKDIFRKLEFEQFLKKLDEESPTMAVQEGLDYRLIDSAAKFDRFFDELSQQEEFAIDTETTSLSPMDAKLVGISFCWEPERAHYVALMAPGGMRPLSKKQTLERLKPLLEDAGIRKIGQNLKYDLIVLRNAGIELRGICFDTMIASYLLDPSGRRHNLDELSEELLGFKKIPTSQLIGSGKVQTTMDQVDVGEVCRYACEDVDCVWRLTELLRPQLQESGLDRLLDEVELPLLHVLAEMEFNGVKIDTGVLAEMSEQISRMMLELEEQIYEIAGGRFNISSPKQLSAVLFEQLNLPKPRKTSLGYSTRASVLENLAGRHPLPAKVLEYRQLAKLESTYIEALPRMVNERTGKIHTSFNQTMTATGRLSSSDPNLQNIPIRTDVGRKVRRAFIPSSKDWVFLTADYSQVELRIMAHLSKDPALSRAFHQGLDIHAFVAAEVNRVEVDDVTPDMRRKAKAVNFGIIYGLTPYGLSRGLDITVYEAERFINEYFERYQRVKEYIDSVIDGCRKDGFVVTMLNRRRYLPKINSSNQQQRRDAERMAINTVIQGSAADLIKVAMNRLYRRLLDDNHATKIILQIHDELVCEVPKADLLFERPLIENEMVSAMALDVPLVVNVAVGDNWMEAK